MSIPMLPASRADRPRRPETEPDDDPALIARGVVFALLFSVPIWILLAVALWELAS